MFTSNSIKIKKVPKRRHFPKTEKINSMKQKLLFRTIKNTNSKHKENGKNSKSLKGLSLSTGYQSLVTSNEAPLRK